MSEDLAGLGVHVPPIDLSTTYPLDSVGDGGAAYENRFVSIVTVENRKIVHWRDYMDSLSAMRALSTKI